MGRRRGGAKQAAARRPYCPTCKGTTYVPGPAVVRNGITYSTQARCEDCKVKPPMKLERGQLPLDAQQRAAGEKGE